ncbi:MAG: Ycf66 family protein, partial [Elainellaceae cyanobacterium]
MAAFFIPEVHRRQDIAWSGVGMFYALALWIYGDRLQGGLLVGQTASVVLLLWLGWQLLILRRQTTPLEQQTDVPEGATVIPGLERQPAVSADQPTRQTSKQSGKQASNQSSKRSSQQSSQQSTPKAAPPAQSAPASPAAPIADPSATDTPAPAPQVDSVAPAAVESAAVPTTTEAIAPPPQAEASSPTPSAASP